MSKTMPVPTASNDALLHILGTTKVLGRCYWCPNDAHLESAHEGCLVCWSCAIKPGFIQCTDCSKHTVVDEAIETVKGLVCPGCHERHYKVCYACGGHSDDYLSVSAFEHACRECVRELGLDKEVC